MKLLWIGAILGLALAGCADRPRSAARPSSEVESPRDTPAGEVGYRLEQEGTAPPADVEFEEDALNPPEGVSGSAFEEAPVASEPLEPVPAEVEVPVQSTHEGPVPTSPPATGQRGFRVQIAALGERVEAEQLAREATNRVGRPTYVVLESGFYKVHLGDFQERASALTARDRCRQLGYRGAWVVSTQIAASQNR